MSTKEENDRDHLIFTVGSSLAVYELGDKWYEASTKIVDDLLESGIIVPEGFKSKYNSKRWY